jgi:hypothetical protein
MPAFARIIRRFSPVERKRCEAGIPHAPALVNFERACAHPEIAAIWRCLRHLSPPGGRGTTIEMNVSRAADILGKIFRPR